MQTSLTTNPDTACDLHIDLQVGGFMAQWVYDSHVVCGRCGDRGCDVNVSE